MKKIMLMVIVSILSGSIYAQEFGIFPTQLNVLYKGIDNPIKVVVANYSCDSIFISSNVEIRRLHACNYIVIPGESGTAFFSVKGIKDSDTINFGTTNFRVKPVPDPVAKVDAKTTGVISRDFILKSVGITAELDNFDFDVRFKIKSYSVVIERDENIIYEKNFNGNRFPTELKIQFSELRFGDKIRFEKLLATEPDNSVRELTPVNFEIKY